MVQWSHYSTGVGLIILVACIWVGASQLIETIFHNMSFDKPYFLTYFNTCGFSLWLLGTAFPGRWQSELSKMGARGAVKKSDAGADQEVVQPCSEVHVARIEWESERENNFVVAQRLAWTYIKVALPVCPSWVLANYLFNLSLDWTSVASNVVLSTTSNIWTMLFSACFLSERLDPVKVSAVALTIAGATLVARSDTEVEGSPASTWGGDALALVSACIYGAYTVQLKRMVPDEERALSMQFVFGTIGLFVLLAGWPVLLILHATGIEKFELPTGQVFGFLLLNALVGTNLSDVMWAKALQLTSPLVATLGLSLTVPIGMLSDMLLRGRQFSVLYISGALLVLLGFGLGCAGPLVEQLRRCAGVELASAHGGDGEESSGSASSGIDGE